MRAAGAGASTSAAAAVGPAAPASPAPGPAAPAPAPPPPPASHQQQPGLGDGDARLGAGADADARAHAFAVAGRLAHGFLPSPLPHAFPALRPCCSWLAHGGSLMLLRLLPLLLLPRGEGGAALRGKAPAMAPASAPELSSVRGNFVALLLLLALDGARSAVRLLVRCFLEEAAGPGAVFRWPEHAEERGLSPGLDVRARGFAAGRFGYRTAGTAGTVEVKKQFVAIAEAGGGAGSVRPVRFREACYRIEGGREMRVHACCGAAAGMELVDWSKSQRGGAAAITTAVVLLYY